ncbi:MAG: glycogen synthase [Deltaproteobacteria bacterium]|jgi:starch synthase|nr:glycogen synthase [Deltaproteobacteria bacterium]
MRIFFVTPEAVPCSRAGGLGDIAYHLPKTLTLRGHQVTVLVPKHRLADDYPLQPLKELNREIDLSISSRRAEYYELDLPGAHNLILVDCLDFFDRPGVYGNEFGDYDDNAERFVFFSKAAFEAIKTLTRHGNETVVHSHDWPTGLVPMYFKVFGKDNPSLNRVGTIFTYHNLANQGTFPYFDFAMTGLDWSYFTFQGLEFHGLMNLTKAGLLGARFITTVSHRYARETLSAALGQGLEGVLKERRQDLRSVIHGVDYDLWDPAIDRFLPASYSRRDILGKTVNRENVISIFGLTPGPEAIVAVVSRLLVRKGCDLLAQALPELMKMPLKLIILGTGDDHFISFFREAAQANPGRLGLKLSYDPPLSHQIMAGADMLLAPSKFEPCGLEQLYALKYGTVPVVRATGGLDDTVTDELSHPGGGTGFKFIDYSPEALLSALLTALEHFAQPESWRRLMIRCMREDYSWDRAAAAYEEIYSQSLTAASGLAVR